MRNLLIVVLFMVSCSKQQTGETEGIRLNFSTNSIFYSKGQIITEPFCNKILYTIKSQVDSSELLIISVVTDKLNPGRYEAGLSHWGKPTLSDNISLNVLSFREGVLNATFTGSISSGIIKNIHI